jgi:hypothetical protein
VHTALGAIGSEYNMNLPTVLTFVLVTFAAAAPLAPAAPVELRFDNAPFPSGSALRGSLAESGYLVAGALTHAGTQSVNRASNASTGYVAMIQGDRARITRASGDSGGASGPNDEPPVPTEPFTALAIDLSEYSAFTDIPTTVTITGVRPDGSTVTASFTTDGVFDGPGGSPDFETFEFPNAFAGVVALDFESPIEGRDAYAFDNVRVEAVPEPVAPALVGFVALALGRRRRHA